LSIRRKYQSHFWT